MNTLLYLLAHSVDEENNLKQTIGYKLGTLKKLEDVELEDVITEAELLVIRRDIHISISDENLILRRNGKVIKNINLKTFEDGS